MEGLDLDSLDLEKAINKISGKLQKASAAADDEDVDDEDEEGFADFWSDEGSVGGWSDDELHLDGDGDSQIAERSGPETPESRAKRIRLWRDLKNDLVQAKSEGFKIGVLGDYRGGMNFFGRWWRAVVVLDRC